MKPTASNTLNIISMIFTLLVLFATIYINQTFITPILWAVIIAIASWPLYTFWKRCCLGHDTLAALSLTIAITLIIIIPLSWISITVIKELLKAIQYLMQNNTTEIPSKLAKLPLGGKTITLLWNKYLNHPNNLQELGKQLLPHYQALSYQIKTVSIKTLSYSANLLLSLCSLFFLYRNGSHIGNIFHTIGRRYLASRWEHYTKQLPGAIRGTINSTLIVCIIIGLLTGISYWLAGINLSALLGVITGISSIIPFGSGIVLLLVSCYLFTTTSTLVATTVLLWGIIVMVIADHIIKPTLVSNSVQLPFIFILLGILGGVNTMGIIGLFLGPIVMVLFMSLINEATKI